MELLKEAKNVVDFASYYPLLNKATTDNDTPTPGYVYEEIIKLSHHSTGHRQHLIEFLLSRLQSSSWPGKQKVVRVLQHLCTRGHRGVRVSLRGQDGELRKAAATGGPPDPLLANTPQLFLNSAIQELLSQLFDSKTMKEDEQWMAGKEEVDVGGSVSLATQGYGSQGVKGKYEGFGSSPNALPTDSLVTQVRGIVERVMSTSGEATSMDLLKGDKGDYQPLSLPSLGSVPPSHHAPKPHLQLLSVSHKNKYKSHRMGRAGGGWDSDEDPLLDEPVSPLTSELDLSLGPASSHSSSDTHSAGAAEDHLLNTLTDSKLQWPLDHDTLVDMSQECVALNLSILLGKISTKCLGLASNEPEGVKTCRSRVEASGNTKAAQTLIIPDSRTTKLLALLLLVEFGMHYDVLPPALVHSQLGHTLLTVKENKCLESAVRLKARKLSLIISKCM